jgi:phage terminase large subunit-like protein
MRVLASDSDTLDGWIGDRAYLDELGRWDSAENYLLLRDGVVPRNGKLIAISTAGDDHSSPLGQLRAKAYAMPGFERDPGNHAHRIARGPDFVLHEWALDQSDDTDDLELVKLANPASWMTVTELRRRHDSPSTQPWMWKRFACGLWVAGEGAAISEREWHACAEEGCAIPAGAKGVIVGCDFGWKWDCTAIVPTRRDQDGIVWVERPAILTPPRDGTSLSVEDVFAWLEKIAKRWPGATIVADPEAGGELVLQRVEAELPGVKVFTYSQRNPTMCMAAQRLAELIAEQKIRHPDDPELNRHVLSAAAKSVGEGWKLVKGRSQNPIDGAIALAMAVSTLQRNREVLFLG